MIAVAAAVVQPQTVKINCRIVNLGATPRRLRAGTTIAQISAIDTNDEVNSAILSDKNVKTNVTTITSLPDSEVELPPHETRIELLEQKSLRLKTPN